MADNKQAAAAQAAAPAPQPKKKGSKKKLFIAGAVLLLAGGAAAGYFAMAKKPEAGGAEASKKEEARKLPNFVDLDPFTVNLAEKEQDRYMQIRFSLEVTPGEAEATIRDMMPALRSEILLTLGSRMAADLASREGKEALAKDIVAAANKGLEHTAADHAVLAVRITQLIIQ